MKYGLIAEHLGHSFSKEIHSMLADYDYELCELVPDELDGFMTERKFSAINVTIPYKQAVIPYLDFISEQARQIGAVNTIVNKNGKLFGYNTDFFGMSELIARAGVKVADKKVLILGTGGTSRTANEVVRSLGATEVVTVSRRGGDGAVTYEEAYEKHTDADVIINTTPVGMFPKINEKSIDISVFPRLSGVIDAIYNPLRTQLVSDALKMGLAAEGGLYMLVAQAVAACEIFLDKALPDGTAEKVYKKIVSDKENIVLVGMPSCGKTTIGRLIAEKTKRAFFDLDEEIVKYAGKTIPEIFESEGERAFRDVESRVILEKISALSGAVIATGGGAILREENVRNLKMNGKLYFLNRPKDQLIPTSDRPTASSIEAMERRYAERLPIYKRVADVELLTDGIAENTASEVIAAHCKGV